MQTGYIRNRNFRFQRVIFAALSFLVAASAAAEVWVGMARGDRSIFMPSYDLLRVVFPSGIASAESLLRVEAPIVWQMLVTTVFRLPLWLVLTIISLGVAYASAKLCADDKIVSEPELQIDIWSPLSEPLSASQARDEDSWTIEDPIPDHLRYQFLDDTALLETYENPMSSNHASDVEVSEKSIEITDTSRT